jgi:hypothetical protein
MAVDKELGGEEQEDYDSPMKARQEKPSADKDLSLMMAEGWRLQEKHFANKGLSPKTL